MQIHHLDAPLADLRLIQARHQLANLGTHLRRARQENRIRALVGHELQASTCMLAKHALQDFEHLGCGSMLQRHRVKFHRATVVELTGDTGDPFHAARDIGDQQGVLTGEGDDARLRRHHGFQRARHLLCGQKAEADHFVNGEVCGIFVERFEKTRGASAHIGRRNDLKDIALVNRGIAVDPE